MLNEIKIQYFLKLADCLKFSTAADQLHITQQALSKQISQLENELDCVLFERTARGVELTDAGQIIEKAFRSMQHTLESAMVEIHNNAHLRANVINIGCAAALRPGPFINPLLNQFSESRTATFWYGHPDSYLDLIHWLLENKFDCVFYTDDFGGIPPELRSVSLCKTPFYYFVGKSNPFASPNAPLHSFKDLGFYLTDNSDRINYILSLCAKERFIPTSIYTTANPYSAHMNVENGNAVTFGTGFCTLHLNPAVRAYRFSEEQIDLKCLYNPSGASALTLDFINYLTKRCNPAYVFYPTGLADESSFSQL